MFRKINIKFLHALTAALIICFSLSAFSQMRPQITSVRPMAPALTSRHAQLKARLQPSVQSWVAQQAHSEAQKSAPDINTLSADVGSRFGACKGGEKAGSPCLQEGDTWSMVFVVLMEAAKEAQAELKAAMDDAKNSKDKKQKMRDQFKRLQSDLNRPVIDRTAKGEKPCPPQTCKPMADLAAQVAKMSNRPSRYNFDGQGSLADAKAALDALKSDLDSMSEMGEAEQLRLQMAQDRMAKIEETLSNVLKKMSQTSDSILSNLK